METVGLLGMLGICSIEDIKRREVEVFSILGFGALGFVIHLFNMSLGIGDMLLGMSVGAVLFLVSILSKGRVGKGDALMVMVSGIYVGFWNNLLLLWGASTMTGVAGLIFFGIKKRKIDMPFAPFLLSMYIIFLVLRGGNIVY